MSAQHPSIFERHPEVVTIVQNLLTVGIQVRVIADWCKGVFSEETLWRELRSRPALQDAQDVGHLSGKALALMALWKNVEAGQQRAIEYWLEHIVNVVKPDSQVLMEGLRPLSIVIGKAAPPAPEAETLPDEQVGAEA